MWQLLMGARAVGLENHSLQEVFSGIMTEKYLSEQEYGIILYHDRYDIPVKALDNRRLGESEQIYFLPVYICFLSPGYALRFSLSVH